MDDERIDLSPLDPSRDPRRWEAMVRRVAERGAGARRHPVLRDLTSRAPKLLALAAALALASWLPALLAKPPAEEQAQAMGAQADAPFLLLSGDARTAAEALLSGSSHGK